MKVLICEKNIMFGYGQRESTRVKGIAIILMFALHFFAHPDWILPENMYATLTIKGKDVALAISNFGHICVALFAFTSGYAMYVQSDKYASFRTRVGKCLSFLLQYWFVIVIFLILGVLLKEPLPSLSTFVLQSVGLGTGVNVGGINVCTAWYVTFYIVFVMLFPILKKISNKSFLFDSILYFVVLYGVSIIISKQPFLNIPDIIGRFIERFGLWGCIGMIGYLFAKYNMFKKVDLLLRNKLNIKVIIAISIVLIPLMVIIRTFSGNIAITDIIYAPILIYAINIIFDGLKLTKADKFISILAQYSTYMWFMHSLFFTPQNSLQWIAYLPKYPLLILSWTLILILGFSILVSKAYGLIVKQAKSIISHFVK